MSLIKTSLHEKQTLLLVLDHLMEIQQLAPHHLGYGDTFDELIDRTNDWIIDGMIDEKDYGWADLIDA